MRESGRDKACLVSTPPKRFSGCRNPLSGTRKRFWRYGKRFSGTRKRFWRCGKLFSGTRKRLWRCGKRFSGTRKRFWRCGKRFSGMRKRFWRYGKPFSGRLRQGMNERVETRHALSLHHQTIIDLFSFESVLRSKYPVSTRDFHNF